MAIAYLDASADYKRLHLIDTAGYRAMSRVRQTTWHTGVKNAGAWIVDQTGN